MFARRYLSTFTSPLRPTIKQLLSPVSPTSATESVQVNGWIRSIRRQKRVAFAVITDGSSPQGLQAVFTDVALAKRLTNGAAVKLTGVLSDSIGPGQDKELQVHAVNIVGESDPESYPILKSAMSTDYLRHHCHLRARTESIGAMLRLRDSTLRTLHSHFESQGFSYVHTPVLTSSDCEGAGETFRVAAPAPSGTTSVSSPSAAVDTASSNFFGRPAYLTVSSQLHLEALASSISRVYTVSPCFRAERSQTGRHLAEFWMLEAEWAFTQSVDDICQVVEQAVKAALNQASPDLPILRMHTSEDQLRMLDTASSAKRWTRISYTDAINALREAQSTSAKPAFKFPVEWGKPLQSEHERWIAEQLVSGPVFVTDYPAELKPFYMRQNSDERTVACFDLLVPDLGELVGGSLREEREVLLRNAIEKHELNAEEYEWYVDLRKYGGAPHGGFGLGFERLIRWMSGIDNIRECIPMPRWAGRMLL